MHLFAQRSRPQSHYDEQCVRTLKDRPKSQLKEQFHFLAERLKGDLRPINDQETRKQLLLELGFVDEVVIFDEESPLEILEQVQPDIIVKGGDYTVETTVGNHLAEVVIFPTVEGHSTSSIIKKIDNDTK